MLQTPRAPITLWSPMPGRGVAARDYLYVAPLDTNISGERQLYLWFAFASSSDRRGRPDAFAHINRLTLTLGDTDHGLVLEPVAETDLMVKTAVAPIKTFRAKVDRDFLALLAEPGSLLVRTSADDSPDQRFTLFQGDRSDWGDVAQENTLQIKASTHHAPLSAPDGR